MMPRVHPRRPIRQGQARMARRRAPGSSLRRALVEAGAKPVVHWSSTGRHCPKAASRGAGRVPALPFSGKERVVREGEAHRMAVPGLDRRRGGRLRAGVGARLRRCRGVGAIRGVLVPAGILRAAGIAAGPVPVSGRHAGGALRAAAIAPDLLATDPAALFPPGTGRRRPDAEPQASASMGPAGCGGAGMVASAPAPASSLGPAPNRAPNWAPNWAPNRATMPGTEPGGPGGQGGAMGGEGRGGFGGRGR